MTVKYPPPKTEDYLKKKDDIVEKLRNLYDEPNEKKDRKILIQDLIDSWKEEDSKNPHKLNYNLRVKGEETSQARRVFLKIFKFDENNQYGFAMTKPLPIGIFKKKESATLEIMNEIVKKYDPNVKIHHILEADIDFSEYDGPS